MGRRSVGVLSTVSTSVAFSLPTLSVALPLVLLPSGSFIDSSLFLCLVLFFLSSAWSDLASLSLQSVYFHRLARPAIRTLARSLSLNLSHAHFLTRLLTHAVQDYGQNGKINKEEVELGVNWKESAGRIGEEVVEGEGEEQEVVVDED